MVSDAFRFIIPLLIIAVLLFGFGGPWAAVLPVLLAVFVAYFFRNPDRTIPRGDNVIVSPADGKVVGISTDGQGSDGQLCLSIFLSIFDVHVNRAPIGGKLEKLEYVRGRFKPAFDPTASQVNEQNVLTVQGTGVTLVMKQIAGLIARRVVCWKKPGQEVQRGEVIGLIRFGSRVEVILPENAEVRVRMGERVKGGSSIIAELR